ncbi:hypothetical protein [uncultured Muribaculum sp.]
MTRQTLYNKMKKFGL